MSRKLKVRIVRLDNARSLPLPSYQTASAAGMDLVAAVDDDIVIMPGQHRIIPAGIAIELPPGYEGQIRPRSGLAIRHAVTVLNSPGTIDADYRGEIAIALINHGSEPFIVRRGDRIAQLVVAKFKNVKWKEVKLLTPSLRGNAGFGSTG